MTLKEELELLKKNLSEKNQQYTDTFKINISLKSELDNIKAKLSWCERQKNALEEKINRAKNKVFEDWLYETDQNPDW